MSTITTLWAERELLVQDGLYFGTGEAVRAELAPGSDTGLRLTEPFDPAAELRADPENVTSVDISAFETLPDGGRLVCGDGSWGAEGFFGRLTADDEVRWLMYFEDSNPFAEITRYGSIATFWSTSAVTITVNIDDPRVVPAIGATPPPS
jgi:hypothetical protein